MLLERSTHPGWLSNAYICADIEARVAVMVDSGAPLDPLLEVVVRHGLEVAAILTTHRHPDHVAGHAEMVLRTDAPVFALRGEAEHVAGALPLEDGEERRWGGIFVRAIHLPGHTPGHAGYLFEGVGLFSGDCLFAGSLGGTDAGGTRGFEGVRSAIVDRILSLPDATPIHPGHAGPTTVGHERVGNPFIRVMTGLDPGGDEACLAMGRPARLVVLARDYDGATKAWVRLEADGSDVILRGSRVQVHAGLASVRD